MHKVTQLSLQPFPNYQHQDPGSLTARNQFETFGCLLEIKEYGGQKKLGNEEIFGAVGD